MAMAKQLQALGALVIAFLALAVLMLFLDGRTASQQAASFATAMDMQMLSQRVARNSVLAAQGIPGSLQAAKEGRYGDRAEEVAARTVMKHHKEEGHKKGK